MKILSTLVLLLAILTHCSSMSLRAEPAHQLWSNNFGGNDGDAFQYFSRSFIFKSIEGEYDQRSICNIKFTFILGINQTEYTSPRNGRKDCKNKFSWTVPADEWVQGIYIKAGNHVNSIQFKTNSGKKSPVLGASGGRLNSHEQKKPWRIAGFGGRSGEVINQLRFFIEAP